MGQIGHTLSLAGELGRKNRGLYLRLALVGATTLVLCMIALLYFDRRLVSMLSLRIIDKSTLVINNQLDGYFTPVERGLLIFQEQLELAELFADGMERDYFQTVKPILQHYPHVSGVAIANSEGSSRFIIRDGQNYLTRGVDARTDRWRGRWRRWQNGSVVESWNRAVDFDPKTRPWYRNVAEAPPGTLAWTDPYVFFTAQQPGISISSKWRDRSTGESYVTAFDITLDDISKLMATLRPSQQGIAMVVTDEVKVVGLPADQRYTRKEARDAAVLSPASELGLPAVADAFNEWDRRERTKELFRFASDGGQWWARMTPFEYAPQRRFWTTVLIPESDILAGAARNRNLTVAAIAGGGVLLAVVVLVSGVRAMRKEVSRIGRKLGQYRLQHKIGEGGNGAVYRASHALLRRPTAVKLMNAEFARSEQARARFEQEVQAVSSLTHPNTVEVYDYGQTPDGTLFYAMEYLTGLPLDILVQASGPLPAARVIHILRQVCGSLAEAHEQGLIHRDIKSANILLCERGGIHDVVKVVDFGLVKELKEVDSGLTQADTLLGTPLFMAPELIQAPDQASPQSDLYALGAVGYYLVTGYHVFEGGSAVEICAAHLQEPPVPPSQRVGHGVPADLEAILLACLAKLPGERPRDAKNMEERLASCADAEGWRAKDAREWWEQHRDQLPIDERRQIHTPISNTALLVDVSDRLKTPGTGTEY